jgi:hypothetical protein
MLNPDPLGRRPYFVSSFEKVPGSFYGKGLPEVYAPAQDAINATLRAAIDNLAFAAAPFMTAELDRLLPETVKSALKMRPRKVWALKGDQYGSGRPPINFIDVPMNLSPLASFLDKMKEWGDELCAIPSYTYGMNKNLPDTLGSLQMLMDNAGTGIVAIVNNVNADIIAPVAQQTADWNNLYTDDPDIKGDCRVEAKGTLANLFRDQTQAARQQLLDKVNLNWQVAQQFLAPNGVLALWRAVGENADIPGLAYSDEEFEHLQKSRALGQPTELPGGTAQPISPEPQPAGAPQAPSPAQAD